MVSSGSEFLSHYDLFHWSLTLDCDREWENFIDAFLEVSSFDPNTQQDPSEALLHIIGKTTNTPFRMEGLSTRTCLCQEVGPLSPLFHLPNLNVSQVAYTHLSDDILDLPLSGESTSPSLSELLRRYHDGNWHCEACGGLKTEERRISILPAVFVLSLKRNAFGVVNQSSVTEAMELDPTAFCSEASTTKYLLHSFIQHEGEGPNSGHFVAFAKQKTNRWIKFNDNTVQELDDEPNPHQACVLVYLESDRPCLERSKSFFDSSLNSDLQSFIGELETREKRTKARKFKARKKAQKRAHEDNEALRQALRLSQMQLLQVRTRTKEQARQELEGKPFYSSHAPSSATEAGEKDHHEIGNPALFDPFLLVSKVFQEYPTSESLRTSRKRNAATSSSGVTMSSTDESQGSLSDTSNRSCESLDEPHRQDSSLVNEPSGRLGASNEQEFNEPSEGFIENAATNARVPQQTASPIGESNKFTEFVSQAVDGSLLSKAVDQIWLEWSELHNEAKDWGTSNSRGPIINDLEKSRNAILTDTLNQLFILMNPSWQTRPHARSELSIYSYHMGTSYKANPDIFVYCADPFQPLAIFEISIKDPIEKKRAQAMHTGRSILQRGFFGHGPNPKQWYPLIAITIKMDTSTELQDDSLIGHISIDGYYPKVATFEEETFKMINIPLLKTKLTKKSLHDAIHALVVFSKAMDFKSTVSQGRNGNDIPRLPVRGIYHRFSFGRHLVFKHFSSHSLRDPNMYIRFGAGAEIINIGSNSKVVTYPFIKGTHNPTSSAQFAPILRKLAEMHKSGYCHGDIRLANMLFATPSDESALIDFDLGGKVDERKYHPTFALNLVDARRHPSVKPGVALAFEHDLYSIHWLMNRLTPVESENANEWENIVALLESTNCSHELLAETADRCSKQPFDLKDPNDPALDVYEFSLRSGFPLVVNPQNPNRKLKRIDNPEFETPALKRPRKGTQRSSGHN